MNSASYDAIRCVSRGKFSIQRFIALKELALNTVGDSNEIFETRQDQRPGFIQIIHQILIHYLDPYLVMFGLVKSVQKMPLLKILML